MPQYCLAIDSSFFNTLLGSFLGFVSAIAAQKIYERHNKNIIHAKIQRLLKKDLKDSLIIASKIKEHLKGDTNSDVALLPEVFSTANIDVAATGAFIESLEPSDAVQVLSMREYLMSANKTYDQLREYSIGVPSTLHHSTDMRKKFVELIRKQLEIIETKARHMLAVL